MTFRDKQVYFYDGRHKIGEGSRGRIAALSGQTLPAVLPIRLCLLINGGNQLVIG